MLISFINSITDVYNASLLTVFRISVTKKRKRINKINKPKDISIMTD